MGEPAPHPSIGRRLAGLAVGVVLLALLAYPLGVLGLFAYSSFTGCFLECSTPEPGSGVLWSGFAALVMAIPLALGMVVAGVRSRAAWLAAGAVVLVVVVGWDVLAVLDRAAG